MKYSSFVAIFSLFVISAFAETIQIGAPPDGTQVKPGKNIKVEVVQPNSIQGPIEVGLVISFLSCATFDNSICPPPNQQLGSILYNGPYNPQYPNPNPYHLQPHQNFTVTIPSGASQGKGQLAVTSFELRGAGPYPTYNIRNITLNVV